MKLRRNLLCYFLTVVFISLLLLLVRSGIQYNDINRSRINLLYVSSMEYNLPCKQVFSKDKNNGLASKSWIGLYSKLDHTNGSSLCGYSNSDVNDTVNGQVNKISSNHPASSENLWIEIYHKNILIRRMVYFDNRTSIGPAIVIILLQKKSAKQQSNLFAKITMPNGIKWCQETQDVKKLIPTIPRTDFRHGPDNYMCIVKKIVLRNCPDIPNYIELSISSSCTDLLPVMPIFYEKYEKRVKFALCLQKGIFGYVSPELLIQFVEINKVLGASIITIWIQNTNTSESIYAAMLPYIKSGLVEVLDWKVSVAMRNFGQYAVNNECLYRNIHRADYMVLHDIDELIIPQKHDTWDEMLEYYNSKIDLSHYASLRFKGLPWKVGNSAAQIPPKLTCSNMNIPYYFNMTERLNKIDESRFKLIVSLNTTIAVCTHHVSKIFKGVKRQYTVSSDIGLCHHYRIPPLDGTYVNSTLVIKKFVNKVMPGIQEKLC